MIVRPRVSLVNLLAIDIDDRLIYPALNIKTNTIQLDAFFVGFVVIVRNYRTLTLLSSSPSGEAFPRTVAA